MLCESSAHIARAELGAHGAVAGVTMRTWTSPRGQVDLAAISGLFAPDMGPFFVRTAAVSVENTHNFAGGAVAPARPTWRRCAPGRAGRRGACTSTAPGIWNAHVATGTPLAAYGAQVDVLAVCFSKGLGAPVGSMMVGSEAAVTEARVWRKRLGGGMRQVGRAGGGAAYALDHHVDRLAEDHDHARLLADACGADPAAWRPTSWCSTGRTPRQYVAAAREEGVLVSAVGPRTVRLVTHLGVTAADAQRAAEVLARL